jgi:hypothetical protein
LYYDTPAGPGVKVHQQVLVSWYTSRSLYYDTPAGPGVKVHQQVLVSWYTSRSLYYDTPAGSGVKVHWLAVLGIDHKKLNNESDAIICFSWI